jgi:hypothetical protein
MGQYRVVSLSKTYRCSVYSSDCSKGALHGWRFEIRIKTKLKKEIPWNYWQKLPQGTMHLNEAIWNAFQNDEPYFCHCSQPIRIAWEYFHVRASPSLGGGGVSPRVHVIHFPLRIHYVPYPLVIPTACPLVPTVFPCSLETLGRPSCILSWESLSILTVHINLLYSIGSKNKGCSRGLCRCDRQAARCFKRSKYNPKLKNINKNKIC